MILFRLVFAWILALTLTILPLPDFTHGIRPSWVLLLALYVQFYLPQYFNVICLFLLGLCLDVLLSTVMGEHAFALVLTCWLADNKVRRFRLFSLGQQMGLIAVFCFLDQAAIFVIDAFVGYRNSGLLLVGNAVMGILLWPWIRLVADDALLKKQKYRASV